MVRPPLVREVALAVAVKLFIIIAAAIYIYGSGQRARIDAATVQARVIGTFVQQP